ncbi:MAG TPA: YjcZ family sporulation protein, partial [Bacilli bacterium]
MYQRGYGFYGNNFAFVLVLFILLVIIGASW